MKSLVQVATSLTEEGHTTKRWLSSTGRWHGGKPLNNKYIYMILTNPVFIGKITHNRNGTTQSYDGLHEPIIEQAIWDRVQKQINSQDRTTLHRWTHPHLLKGKLRTADGFAISPTSTHRPLTKRGTSKPGNRQKRLVRYYVSQKAIKHGFKSCQIKSINASHLDDLVRGIVLDHVESNSLDAQPQEVQDRWLRNLVDSVTLAPDKFTIRLDSTQLEELKQHDFGSEKNKPATRPTCFYKPEIEDRGRLIHLTLQIQIKKLDGRRMLLSPDGHDLVIPSKPEPKRHIVDAIGLAYRWHDSMLASGQFANAFADEHSIARTRVYKLLPLVNLSPTVLNASLRGTLTPRITLDDLLVAAQDLDWAKQERQLSLPPTTPDRG
ncbi:MAG: site-specific DNA recombinase [Phycisphaerales bacterium]|jgi:site-specific DNA recombinase